SLCIPIRYNCLEYTGGVSKDVRLLKQDSCSLYKMQRE
ncbi:hypothetical protein M144_4214, partial [Bacteroides fragilis str. 3-F-2 